MLAQQATSRRRLDDLFTPCSTAHSRESHEAKALIDECASGGLQAIKPVVGVTFGVGDCEDANFGRKFKEDESIGKSRK